MPYPNTTALIRTEDLSQRLGDPHIKVLDATYFIPPDPRNPREEYRKEHLPGALFFDIDAIADPDTDLPHMLPSPEDFAKAVGSLGIENKDFIAVYDTHGLMSAARAWWMFKTFGHDQVAVLDGGLPKWKGEGRPVAFGEEHPSPVKFHAAYRRSWVRSANDVLNSLASRNTQLLDMRSSGRFQGKEPEPRAGLRSGHIPGSRNLPWAELLDPDTKTVLPPETLQALFNTRGIDFNRPVTGSCGSGITACLGIFGLYLMGHPDLSVYDGSWAEWGADPSLPLESVS